MSKKTLETMTQAMRSRTAPSTFAAPSVKPISSRVAPRLWRPAVGLAVLAGGAALLFTPARHAEAHGLTWNQIATATALARTRHGVITDPLGGMVSEFWSDRGRDARVTRFKTTARHALNGRGRSAEETILEHRFDGHQSFQLMASSRDGSSNQNPNALRVGSRYTSTGREDWRRTDGWHDYPGGSDALGDLLAKKDVTILSERRIGTQREVRLRMVDERITSAPLTGTIVADEQGRIVSAVGFGSFRGAMTLYDYPQSIPNGIFEPRPQIWPATVIDHEPARRGIAAGMAKGLGRDRGVTLRAVLLDRRGELYVLYSGAVPSGALPRAVRIDGTPASKPYGLKPWVQGAPQPAFVGGVRIGGMAITPYRRLPRVLTLHVPIPGGEATFRNVKPTRVVSIYDFKPELGLPQRKMYIP